MVAAGLLALVVLARPGPAGASCPSSTSSITSAVGYSKNVFVGKVVKLANENRWATFAVEEVWKGHLQESRIEVRAGPPNPPGGLFYRTSGDRTFARGTRYLVFPSFVPEGGEERWGVASTWTDDLCSPTREYQPAMAAFRPASARIIPQPASPAPDAPVGPLLVGLALFVASGGAAVAVLRARSWRRP